MQLTKTDIFDSAKQLLSPKAISQLERKANHTVAIERETLYVAIILSHVAEVAARKESVVKLCKVLNELAKDNLLFSAIAPLCTTPIIDSTLEVVFSCILVPQVAEKDIYVKYHDVLKGFADLANSLS